MMKYTSSKLSLPALLSVLFFASCSDFSHVTDPDKRSDIAGWYHVDEGMSSGSSSSISSEGSSSSSSIGTSSAASSSSMAGTSSSITGTSSAASSSSVSATSSATVPVSINPQTCTYTPGTSGKSGTPDGLLDCREKKYKTVTIRSENDSLTLMAENLNIGTMLPGAAAGASLSSDTLVEKFCFGDSEANCTSDGGLYQWSEAMGFKNTCNAVPLTDASCDATISSGHHQGICPMGWHIPKAAEWDLLAKMLGGNTVAGKVMKLKDTEFSDWDAATFNDGNSSGFSALPAGKRKDGGGFDPRGQYAYFWEASENATSYAGFRALYSGGTALQASFTNETNGYSVRCFQDY